MAQSSPTVRVKRRQPVFVGPDGTPLRMHDKSITKMDTLLLPYVYGAEAEDGVMAYTKKQKDTSVLPKLRRVAQANVTVYNPEPVPWKGTLRPGEHSPLCNQCALYSTEPIPATPFFKPVGSASPLVTIITDGITIEEDRKGVMGVAGSMASIHKLMVIWAQRGEVDLNSVRWLPITRCAGRGKANNVKIKGNWCRYHVIDDLLRHPPKLIITVGTQVTGLFSHKSNVQDWAGRVLTYRGWPDDWLTNKFYALKRPNPADPTGETYVLGHPLFGPQPSLRIPLVPVQSPAMVRWEQNPISYDRFIKHVKMAVDLAKSGWTPPQFLRPWYRFTTDVNEIEAGLREILKHPGVKLAFDTETKGLRGWANDAGIVSFMFRWVDPTTGEPRSIGFPFEFEFFEGKEATVNPVFQHVQRLWPLIWEALCSSTLIGHNLTFDVLYTYSRRFKHLIDKFGDSALNKRRDAFLCQLVDAAKYDTWHMAYVLRQQRERLGLEHMTYRFAKDLAGYEEEMTLLIDLMPDLLDPETRKHGTDAHYLNCPLDKWESHLIPYVMGDTEATYRTHTEITKRLDKAVLYAIPLAKPGAPGMFRMLKTPGRACVYDYIMSPASQVLTKMMARGMFVDIKRRDRINNQLKLQIAASAKAFLEGCQEHIDEQHIISTLNITSVMELDLDSKIQLHTLFFNENCLNLPVYRLTKKGRQLHGETVVEWRASIASEIIKRTPRITQEQLDRDIQAEMVKYAAIDKFTLNQLAVKHQQLRSLLDYRKLFKLQTVYVEPLLADEQREKDKASHLMFDNCVHASFMLTGTRGGRLCVAGDTKLEIMIGGEKILVEIRDLWKYKDQHVFIRTHRGRWRRITRLYFKGYERMYEAVTKSGCWIKATTSHRVFSARGWQSLGDVIRQKLDLQVDLEFKSGNGSGRAQFSATGAGEAHELSADERSDFSPCRPSELEGLSGIEVGTSSAASGAISGRAAREPKRKTGTFCASSKTKAGSLRFTRDSGGTDCRGNGHNAVFSRAEYPEVWVAEIGQRSGSRQNFDRESVEKNRGSLSGVDGGVCNLFYRQGKIFQEGLSGVYDTSGTRMVFEGYVPNAFYATEGGQGRSGGNLMVDEPPRVGAVTRVDFSEDSKLSRICLQGQSACGFRPDRHQSVGGNRWGIPHRSSSQRVYQSSTAVGLPGASVYDTASSVQNGGGCCGDTGRFETIVQCRSAGVQAVWDIEVEEDHSYLAQGFFHHNSCRDPNLQQLPRDGSVKELYTSRFGLRGCLYQADLSQIELRLMAAACGDPTMVDAYFKNIDLHSLTASRIFSTPYEHFTKDHMEWLQGKGRDDEAKLLDLNRTTAKTVNFLTGYGGGAFGLQNILAMKGIFKEQEECQNIIELFFNSYPALRALLQYYKRFILDNLCAVSIFGRVRFFEEAASEDGEVQSKALRAGCNHLIQSTASDMMLIALFVIEDWMRDEGLESILVSTVHDSLVIDAIRDELPIVHEIVDTVLNNFPTVLKQVFGPDFNLDWMLVPFAGDSEVGLDYLHMKKIPKKNVDWNELLNPKKKE